MMLTDKVDALAEALESVSDDELMERYRSLARASVEAELLKARRLALDDEQRATMVTGYDLDYLRRLRELDEPTIRRRCAGAPAARFDPARSPLLAFTLAWGEGRQAPGPPSGLADAVDAPDWWDSKADASRHRHYVMTFRELLRRGLVERPPASPAAVVN